MEDSFNAIDEVQPKENEYINIVQLCVFKLGGELFAIDILQVHEIINPQIPTFLPTAKPYILGVINLRGAIIPLLEIHSFVGMSERKEKSQEIMIIREGNLMVGVSVDKVMKIVNIPENDIIILGEDDPIRREKYILGTGNYREEMIRLLDTHRLIRDAKASI